MLICVFRLSQVQQGKYIPTMNPFEFAQLQLTLDEIDKRVNCEKGKSLLAPEFDIFIERRVENDEDQNLFEVHFPEEAPPMAENFDINQPIQYDVYSMADDNEFSVAVMDQQEPEIYTPDQKFEMESNISAYVPGNNEIFQEASFMIVDNDQSMSSLESLKSEMNIRRTMAKLKKLGDGTTQFIPSTGIVTFSYSFRTYI